MSAAGAGSLSLVIPAFNEEERLPPTLAVASRWLAGRGLDAEIVVVDDGSHDATAARAEAVAATCPVPILVLREPRNRGKGWAVRRGVAAATRAVVLFSDADLSTPIEEADKLLAALAGGADLAIGTRAAPGSRIEVHQPWYREAIGKAGNLLVRALTGMPFRDTQCGFKAFRAEVARELFAALTVERFGFDVEILYLARRRGFRIVEVPVTWRNSPNSRVDPLRDTVRTAVELLGIRLRALLGRHDRRR